jgi:hypothetical protein
LLFWPQFRRSWARLFFSLGPFLAHFDESWSGRCDGLGLEGIGCFERAWRCQFQPLCTLIADFDLLRGRIWRDSGFILLHIVSPVVLNKVQLRFRSYLRLEGVLYPNFSQKRSFSSKLINYRLIGPGYGSYRTIGIRRIVQRET